MDDSLILTLLERGDKDAYKQLFIKYYSPLCEYASHYLSNESAEELVQDLMLYIWENRKCLFVEVSLKSYLFASVKHRCLNELKREQCHKRIQESLQESMKEQQFEDPDFYLSRELEEQIQKAIEELPETFRQTFILSRFTHLTNAQIAKKLSISVKTVEYRISQALKILKSKLL